MVIAARSQHSEAAIELSQLIASGKIKDALNSDAALHWAKQALKFSTSDDQQTKSNRNLRKLEKIATLRKQAHDGDSLAMARLAVILWQQNEIDRSNVSTSEIWKFKLSRTAAQWANKARQANDDNINEMIRHISDISSFPESDNNNSPGSELGHFTLTHEDSLIAIIAEP